MLFAFIVLATTGLVSPLSAQSVPKGGSEPLQALFLINFIRFTEWPAAVSSGKSPFVIGVAGNRSLEDELIALAETQRVRERRVHVIRIKTINDLEGCHLVYIASSVRPGEESAPGSTEILPRLRNKPVMTVSESPSFLSEGGIVNFFLGEEGKLRFEIDLANARASGLELSSRLLALARVVSASSEPAPERTP